MTSSSTATAGATNDSGLVACQEPSAHLPSPASQHVGEATIIALIMMMRMWFRLLLRLLRFTLRSSGRGNTGIHPPRRNGKKVEVELLVLEPQ